MRTLLMVLALLALAPPVHGQSAEAEVLAVVERLFDGMRSADTTLMRSTLHPDVRLISTLTRDGVPVATPVPIQAWLDAVASADQVLDERLHQPEVRVEGGLATVWTFYALYVGPTLSHCGYDAFQLVRVADGWRIMAIADTRRREDCDPPPAEPPPSSGAGP